MAGPDRHRNFFNAAWLNFTGRTMEQESGAGWAVSIYPDDFEKCMGIYNEAFDQRKAYNMEYRLRRYDGEYRWISARGVPRLAANGNFEGFIGACMDIHEQVIYQQKLKEDEERLNIIIEASELGTWELNLETRAVSYSDRYIEILGHKKGEILTHQQILKHLHPDDLHIREAAFKIAFDTGHLHYESRIIWPNGSLHWIEGSGKVFYDEKGKPFKMIGTVRDITEEKNYQQQLKEREEKFRLLADSMPQHIWTADTAGNINYFNKSVYDYSGLTPEQIHKDGWLQIVHEEEKEKNVTEWLKSVSTGKDFLFEHRFRRHDGEYRWQLSRAIPQRDAAGNIQMWVGTSTDIQEIKEQDQQKDFFISMASHELKTPITSIKGYVQLLQSTYGNSEDAFLTNSLAVVEKQVLTLTRLISDLLDVSKIKLGNLVLNKQDFEITEMIQDVINHIQQINPDYRINFSGSNVLVHADRERISQVLINFLNNAVKYSPNSKEITVKNVIKDGQVMVFVQDSGIGINKADQEKIFERFYRVTGKDEKTYPGFGIGLFICSQIIERHQGKVGVTSEPGKGAVFYFSIPLNN
jgi:PAS domain S-box-containing protein